MPGEGRVFLFLQGPSSLLFSQIADNLARLGNSCLRINFNLGDQLFWRRKGATAYRGSQQDWPAFIDHFLEKNGVTDLVLLGEERPYHRVACAAAARRNIGIAVVEMGYLRPDWIVLERTGMSSNSHFPADADHILAAAKHLDEPDFTRRYTQTFTREALSDLAYNLPAALGWFAYPHYRFHGLYHPLLEYAGWVRKAFRKPRMVELDPSAPTFLYPLQLQTDFQLRAHSPFADQQAAINLVLDSFARSAPADAMLIVKQHPLDPVLFDWQIYIDEKAEALAIATRVRFTNGGALDPMIATSRGVVTVNSTVGLTALRAGKPVRVLGCAVFDVQGLTDQQPLDQFWQNPLPPDADLCAAFIRLIAASIHVRGNFYSRDGVRNAARDIALRLHTNTLNQPGGYVANQPRKQPEKC